MAVRVSLAVCFVPLRFDRIVLPCLPDCHTLHGLTVFVNHNHLPIRGSKRTAGKQPQSE